ncbi:DNA topoisomerase III domain protein [Escherichia coli 2-005-03_S4_C1]|uniref:hypothetical protein n=1 Tax=Escherichia coli TaxID=562 RepID=UPI0004616224|nr:hypothetical protein [Escherichia coli]KDA76481.1 DNA topoisomerase III domain protein [Escherichia coli 2-011-08_S3_C2]KDW69732.1 DNA topoisomerase III domain protein [Escherichia coli 2-005-03_S4_C1]KDY84003.1 DNA topoisomerase III domain protein [Escherichia coli 2-474-04_S3_C1]KDY87036.1 DNA topoisomerase III domain protein [Escherichia coli 2-474-04_S3_C2]KDZ10489.1 DNA topoisomerase III domain protein [Escherichia coli 2-474-04_S3_C3]
MNRLNEQERLVWQTIAEYFLVPGQQLQCVSATAVHHKTTPPPLFTEDTLLAAMARIADVVTDERVRALLRQKDEDKEKERGGTVIRMMKTILSHSDKVTLSHHHSNFSLR